MLNTLPDALARFFLGFSQIYVVLGLIAIGYVFLNRSVFYHSTLITILSVITNVALKVTFQIPLSSTLNKTGFAFPSGHMQTASVFYLWLLFNINSPITRFGSPIILTGIAYGLMHFQYHNFLDIVGGLIFAQLLIVAYQLLLSAKLQAKLPWILMAYATLLLIYIAYRFAIPTHAWQAYGLLIGLILLYPICKHDISVRYM